VVEDGDFLFTVAEVAAAFAGFAGLVTVVARGSGSAPEHHVNLLRNMLLLALLIVLASLAPHVCARVGLSESSAWRVAGGGFLVGWAAYVVHSVPIAYRYVRDVNPREGRLWYPHLALHVATGLSLVAVATGLGNSGLYSLALFIVLYMAAYLLLRLFLALARG
jgi:hypothetical protein